MGFKSDIEIAQEAKPQDIREIAKKLGLTEDDLELYGKYKAIHNAVQHSDSCFFSVGNLQEKDS